MADQSMFPKPRVPVVKPMAYPEIKLQNMPRNKILAIAKTEGIQGNPWSATDICDILLEHYKNR